MKLGLELVVILLAVALTNAETEEEARIWHRRKKPCHKSTSSSRTFFTFLLGDLVVQQPIQTATAAYEDPCIPPHATGTRPPLFNHGTGSKPPLFGGLGSGSRPPLFGGLGSGSRPPLFGGGLLSSFGSLFNGNGVRPTIEIPGNDKPIFETVEEDEVTEDYRPGVVGAPSQDVGGVAQDLSNFRPDKVVRRINRQLNKYFINPLVDLFYR